MAHQPLSTKTPSKSFRGQERAVTLPAVSIIGGRRLMLDPKNGSTITSGGFEIVRAAAGSMVRPIWEAAIEIDRLVREAIQRFATLVPNWRERDVQQRRLQRLSDHMLRDIGASHHDVDYRSK